MEHGHADSHDDLSTPDDDDQVEPGAQPWTEEDDDQAAERVTVGEPGAGSAFGSHVVAAGGDDAKP